MAHGGLHQPGADTRRPSWNNLGHRGIDFSEDVFQGLTRGMQAAKALGLITPSRKGSQVRILSSQPYSGTRQMTM